MHIYLFTITLGVILGILVILLVRFLNRSWWNVRWVKLTTLAIPITTLLSLTLWYAGRRFGLPLLGTVGAPIASGLTVVMIGLILTLPLAGLFNLVDRLIVKWRERSQKSKIFRPDPARRTFLRGAAVAFPMIALATGAGGISASFTGVKVYKRKIEFADLPPGLEGFKILHLSDSHLGIYRFLPDWEEVVKEAARYRPDLVLISGDIADDLSLLGDALKLAEDIKAPQGVYASLGNHEYYRGIERVRRIFDRGTVPLLTSQGVELNVNGTTIYIAGADDPRYMNQDTSGFLENTVNMAVKSASNDSFKIVMSHRPEGFDPAVKEGVNLTLAGHTHGGQIGIGGRSVFSNIMPDSYLWGLYGDSKNRLYVSSGIGHWFPFRLGCPAEAPVIELTRSKEGLT